MSEVETVWMFPGDAADPYAGKAGASLVLPYSVLGVLPQRRVSDVVLSVQKHLAEVLDQVAADWLHGIDQDGNAVVSPAWEVRGYDEQTALRLPFATVQTVGPDTVSPRRPTVADHSQAVNCHLYPHPAQDAERAILGAEQLRSLVEDAFAFGAARTYGLGPVVPLWDFSRITDLYGDSEARHPADFVRVSGLTTERVVDPEDDRYVWVVVNFRAQWRRTAGINPGRLVQSVRVGAHPE